MNRNLLVVCGMFAWTLWILIWVYPLKRRLQQIHGFDKSNDHFIELGKQGDPLAKQMLRRTWIAVGVGIAGGVLMAFTNQRL